ncbi:hypothetical protein BPMI_04843 [Candidatus Burkholderia pumila]|uniref:Uncharacterized protein n=1 Tax=Candidatus Burkholderia pumila TaxID=1090375 RepID=A0ABR5HM20_9BURK|nr:hypothetical protein BPMI_04843 [Candidatus Burkholderia pumila]
MEIFRSNSTHPVQFIWFNGLPDFRHVVRIAIHCDALHARCLRRITADEIASTLAPIAIALIFPLVFTEGAYFYDFPELMFLALAVWLATTGRVGWLIVVTLLATLNKEPFLIFTLTLNAAMKLRYAHNGGDVVQFHLLGNLAFLANPFSYLHFEYNYGVVMAKGYNVITIALVVTLLRLGWHRLPATVRQHVWIALVLNVPVFIMFGWKDDLRNLSMLLIGFLMLVCMNISLWLATRRPVEVAAHAPMARSGDTALVPPGGNRTHI